MTTKSLQAWQLAQRHHGVVTRDQLLRLGFSDAAIRHRIERRRLHPVHRGVYAVGRSALDQYGWWMAAVLSCGPRAVLSHSSAQALWKIGPESREIEISVPATSAPKRCGITVHRRAGLGSRDITCRRGIPVTTPVCTLIDLATRLPKDELEAAVNEADSLRVVRVDALRARLVRAGRRPGAARLRNLLDRRTFVLTDSHLERLFLPLARQAGLSAPATQVWLNGFKVDFYWADLGLVVETDSLTYHRTPGQQNADRRRDQAHTAAGLTVLRFTHAQVKFEPRHVVATLRAVVERIHR
jgi:very-short-patch-repair endonuclease